MNALEVLPAPEIHNPSKTPSKWERERSAFRRLQPTLLADYRGQYVAIHEGQVVDSGPDQIEVALRVYKRFGYLPIYVGLVSQESQPVLRLPTRFLDQSQST